MKNITRTLFAVLKNTFIITVLSLLLALMFGDETFLGRIAETTGLYGAILSANLFLIHVVMTLITYRKDE